MPDKVIEIPGVGTVSFPSTLSDEEVSAAAARLHQEQQGALQVQAQPATPPPPSLIDRGAALGRDLAIGAAKGAVRTVSNLGTIAREYIPGVAALDRVMTPVQVNVTPENTAQRLGMTVEQLAEYFVPAGLVKKAGTVAGAAAWLRAGGGSGTLAKLARLSPRAALEFLAGSGVAIAQGAAPGEAATTGAISAAIPGVGVLNTRVARQLTQTAEKRMAQALGATKQWAKTEAAELAPEMLRRGVRGSREQMLDRATAMVGELNNKIGAELTAAARAGKTIDGATIRSALEGSKDAFTVTAANGARIPIEGTQPIVKQLEDLKQFVSRLPADIPFEDAQQIKVAWGKIVSKSGLYGPKAQSSATDNAASWALREATSQFKDRLAKGSATLDELNREFGFWKGLRDVLKETTQRTQAQQGGLSASLTSAVGAGAGFVSGDDFSDRVQSAVLGGVAGRQLVRVMQSPWWRSTASAPFRHNLASALASGHVQRAQEAATRVIAAAAGGSVERTRVPAQAVSR